MAEIFNDVMQETILLIEHRFGSNLPAKILVCTILQISDQVRMDLRFCRECHSRQRFFVACFRRAHDENLKFTPEKPSNRALISRFSSQLIGNL